MNPKPYLLFFCFSLVTTFVSVCAQETASPQTDAAPTDSAAATTTDPSILQYLNQIAEQEKLHGAYDPQLAEQLLGLGLLYRNLGQYDESGKALDRALHIRKVNDGLQNMTQVPILNALIKVNTAAGNWEELDQNYHTLLWLHQRNLKSGDPALLPVILTVGSWKLEAYRNGLIGDSRAAILYDLVKMFQTTVDIMEDLYGENDPRLIGPLKILSLAYYQQVNEVMNTPLDEFHGIGNRVSYQQKCYRIPRPDGSSQMVCGMEEVPNPNYFVSKQQTKDIRIGEQMHKVRSLLNRITTITAANSATQPSEHAIALVNLGDWYFMNNLRDTAVEKYKQAYHILTDNGSDPALIKKLFGKPVGIPVMTTALPAADAENTGAVAPPFVRLAFNVSVDGRAKNIQVLEESEPKSYRARNVARELVNSAIFRPRLQDGLPVATEGTELLLYGAILQSGSGQDMDRYSIYGGSRMRR